MNKLRWLAILMGAVMLAITGFQVYWLKDNYNREQKAIEVRAQVLFRETVREMKDAILEKKIREVLKDTSGLVGFKRKTFDGTINAESGPPGTARVLHFLGEQLREDSAKNKKGVFISLNKNAEFQRKDSTGRLRFVVDSLHPGAIDEMVVLRTTGSQKDSVLLQKNIGRSRALAISKANDMDTSSENALDINTIFFNTKQGDRFKIKIDSLFNDSLSIEELSQAFAKKLDEQKLDLPFTILRQREEKNVEEDFIRRPFTFENFEGYKLQLGNTFSYLIKKITWPILFSLFLVGLTILSFVLFYRSLLRQHRLAQMKNDLISNITHELKTPIATVGVAIEALKNFNAIQDPQKTKEYLDISQNELQRLGLLVDKVLKLSMFENREIEIKYEVFDLEEAVNEVVASLRLQLEKYNARIDVSAEGNLLMRADRTHLLSVIFNLFDNALKYSKGDIAIEVGIKEENEVIVLKVADNGIGIPAQYRDKIFEKFFRVPTGDTHNAKGHGLGLSYVSQVVRQHHGSIAVDSNEGQGSVFSIRLPKNL